MKFYEDKEYQLMCIEAKELIGKWERKPGRFFMGEFGDINIVKDLVGNSCTTGLKHEHKLSYPVPLWTQEDLQEMVSFDLRIKLFNSNPALMGFRLFYDRTSMNWKRNEYFWQFKTYTQLWLAFVYHKLYQKRWNPEKKNWEPET